MGTFGVKNFNIHFFKGLSFKDVFLNVIWDLLIFFGSQIAKLTSLTRKMGVLLLSSSFNGDSKGNDEKNRTDGVLNENITAQSPQKDHDGRYVAHLYFGDLLMNAERVKQGLPRHISNTA